MVSVKKARLAPYALKYVLKKENGEWSGQLFESWNPSPTNIVFRKIQEKGQ
jgi:hypothetical protein